jgi:hypothetical protein
MYEAAVNGEDNLVPMSLVLPDGVTEGTVRLSTSDPYAVRAWTNTNKQGLRLLEESASSIEWSVGQQPAQVWLEGVSPTLFGAVTFQLDVTPTTSPRPGDVPATTQANAGVVAATLEAIADQEGTTIPSRKEEGLILKHYVTPKAADKKIIVTSNAPVPGGQVFNDVYEWVGGNAAGQPHQHEVSRAQSGRFQLQVKHKATGNVLDTMVVWVVWATAENTSVNLGPFEYGDAVVGDANPNDRKAAGFNQIPPFATKQEILWKIEPASIHQDVDRPRLSGTFQAKAAPSVPAGQTDVFNHGVPLEGGVSSASRWDASRQVRMKMLNPGVIPLPAPLGNYHSWPQLPIGNDDRSINDEHLIPDEDPYKGFLRSVDTPSPYLNNDHGAVGAQVEMRLHYREFARLALDGTWHAISEPWDWRLHAKFAKVRENGQDLNMDGNAFGSVWIDDGSTIAADHQGW